MGDRVYPYHLNPVGVIMALSVVADVAVEPSSAARTRRVFPWVVFALTFALLLSDYMSRQVLSAVFPYLKQAWGLTDTQLGTLTSVVALAVAVLAAPLSLVGDRWGRVRAIVVMAIVWSLATVGSALAGGYGHLLIARLLIGVGEAAYGSVGLAVVLALFAPHRRASLTGAFMAGGSFGSVLGVALGGAIAARVGWRGAFAAIGIIGLTLALLYAAVVRQRSLATHRVTDVGVPARARLSTLVSTPSVVLAYVGGGLQLFVTGSLFAWLPSYFNRAYHLSPGRSASLAAVLILIVGVGMIGCGAITDRLSHARPLRSWSNAVVFAALSLVLIGGGFALAPGRVQLILLAIGCFFTAGTAGPTGALVARLTPESIRSTAFGTLTFFNNVLGLAAGPLVTGILADRLGLTGALTFVPLISVAAIIALLAGRAADPASLRRPSADAATKA
jgi:predicted MFS family arabinose efflux permease